MVKPTLLTWPFRTMFYHFMRITCLAVLFSLFVNACAAELPEGVRRVKVLNYPDCFELSNADARVTLCHQVGGRVLEYSFKGKNALYLDPDEAKWRTPGGPREPDSAGRFDIGPEYLIPERPKLWSGEWQAEAIGPRAVRLTSQADEGNRRATRSRIPSRRKIHTPGLHANHSERVIGDKALGALEPYLCGAWWNRRRCRSRPKRSAFPTAL
jgi:hypothetical protein